MKSTESWLREWVNPKESLEKIGDKLTMTGFEVEEMMSVAKADYAKDLSHSSTKDTMIDFAITPNRGDCLSVRGLAREISAATKSPLKLNRVRAVKATIKDKFPVKVAAKAACPRYLGRVMRNVDATIATPAWLRDRLMIAGVKSISIIVDIANYVMLELGQPLHAFDLDTLDKEINVRMARSGEKIALLDGTEKTLNTETLIIADKKNPLAIAGIMGSMGSGVSASTTNIFLESAFFSNSVIASERQAYLINSEAASRFERGVDPYMQREAIERATQLILDNAGGSAGPITEVISKPHLPKIRTVTLTAEKLENLLGVEIPKRDIENIFKSLQFPFKRGKNKWTVKVPSYRFDITIEEDLVEEVARLYGFENIPAQALQADIEFKAHEDSSSDLRALRQVMVDQGYQEIISYSFVDKAKQALFDPETKARELQNPITADMNVMRTNMWPGLINTMLYNLNRQQSRLRLFEVGTCFIPQGKSFSQVSRIAGLITGNHLREQWGVVTRKVDFFDLKGDVLNLLQRSGEAGEWEFVAGQHPALHPGQTAYILKNGKKQGVIGALHPTVLQELGLSGERVYLFEVALNELVKESHKPVQEISKFPENRRDIAILVNQAIPITKIQDTIREVAGAWLKEVFVFDVYQGKGIAPGQRSVALALILQHPNRTLVDEEVVTLMQGVTTTLKDQFGAELRS